MIRRGYRGTIPENQIPRILEKSKGFYFRTIQPKLGWWLGEIRYIPHKQIRLRKKEISEAGEEKLPFSVLKKSLEGLYFRLLHRIKKSHEADENKFITLLLRSFLFLHTNSKMKTVKRKNPRTRTRGRKRREPQKRNGKSSGGRENLKCAAAPAAGFRFLGIEMALSATFSSRTIDYSSAKR